MNTIRRGIGAITARQPLDSAFATPAVQIIVEPETLIIACSEDTQSYRDVLKRPSFTYNQPQTINVPGSIERPIPQFVVPGGFPTKADFSRISDLLNIHPSIVNIGIYTHADSCGLVGAVIKKIENQGNPIPVFNSEADEAIRSFIKFGLTKQDILNLVRSTDKYSAAEKVAKVLAKTIAANLAHELTQLTPTPTTENPGSERTSFGGIRVSARTRLENGLTETIVSLTRLNEIVPQSPTYSFEEMARRSANGPRPSHPMGTGTLPVGQGTVLQRSAPDLGHL